jgi:hypothetical protein
MEAFYKRIPVLAYAATAVPATMDGGGVLYDTKDPLEIARLIDAVLDDPRIEEAVLQSQDAALQRLWAKNFDQTLLQFVDQTLALPPRDAPEVTFDFWHQFDQFDRFEELRQFRPALYKALPIDPASVVRDPGSGGRDPGSVVRDPGSVVRDPASAVRDPRSDQSQQFSGSVESRITDPGFRSTHSRSRIPDPTSRR